MSEAGKKSKKKNPDPTGIAEIDILATLDRCSIQEYVPTSVLMCGDRARLLLDQRRRRRFDSRMRWPGHCRTS